MKNKYTCLFFIFLCISKIEAEVSLFLPKEWVSHTYRIQQKQLRIAWALYNLASTNEQKKYIEQFITQSITSAWNINPQELHKDFISSFCLINAPYHFLLLPEEESLPEITNIIPQALYKHLQHTSLKGHYINDINEVPFLPDHEIDVGKTLLLAQIPLKKDDSSFYNLDLYIDFLSLVTLSKLPHKELSPPEEKIKALNETLFFDLNFRFPPESEFKEEIDLYTYLPSVIEQRRGVCLGVSMLYYAIAQRIALPLEIITPPGHIYLRYKTEKKTINIETTARGINLPSDVYLDWKHTSFTPRSNKELIGMGFVNQASTYLTPSSVEKACYLYEQALVWMPRDPLVLELYLYTLFLLDKSEYQKIAADFPSELPEIATLVLQGKVDKEALFELFLPLSKERQILLEKKERLLNLTKRCPEFFPAWSLLSAVCLQLHEIKAAKAALAQIEEQLEKDPQLCFLAIQIALEENSLKDFIYFLVKFEKIAPEHIKKHPQIKELLELKNFYISASI